VNWGIEELDNVYQDLWGIRMYYQFLNEEEMEMAAIMWMAYTQNETRKLKNFQK
jgi:hypothetical protein